MSTFVEAGVFVNLLKNLTNTGIITMNGKVLYKLIDFFKYAIFHVYLLQDFFSPQFILLTYNHCFYRRLQAVVNYSSNYGVIFKFYSYCLLGMGFFSFFAQLLLFVFFYNSFWCNFFLNAFIKFNMVNVKMRFISVKLIT